MQIIRSTTICNLAIICYGVIFVWLAFNYAEIYKVYVKSTKLIEGKEQFKLIYLDKMPSYYEIIMGDKHFKNCQMKSCEVSNSPGDFERSDAVLYFSHYRQDKSPPPKRHGQIWMYFAVESPINSYNEILGSPKWKNHFNWTITYRFDSDIRFGYGKVLPRETILNNTIDYTAITEKKKKIVAWLVSNCKTQSKRDKFVDLLRKRIPVDIYGKCGTLQCEDCMNMIEKNYKFYLSFENSICKDYITEKVFHLIKHNIVPVVRGGAKYEDILPEKSFIKTSDFKTVDDLVNYLTFLDANPREYMKYFEWKKYFQVFSYDVFPFCEMCQKIHNPSENMNVYENVDDWWRKNACWEPEDLES